MADAKTTKRDIEALEDATRQLAKDLDSAYREYLTILVDSLRRQVVSACYGLCTRGYPEQFLKLTFNQREQVQQSIQQAIAQSCAQLAEPDRLIDSMAQRRRRSDERARAAARAAAKADLGELLGDGGLGDGGLGDRTSDSDDGGSHGVDDGNGDGQQEQTVAPKAEQLRAEQLRAEQSDLGDGNASASANTADHTADHQGQIDSSDEPAAQPPKSGPPALLEYQDQLETSLAYTVESLADRINDALREADIMPQELPETMLEAVIKAGSAEVIEGPPNVLSLLVQADEDGDYVAPIMAIRLQVSELEFNDTRLSAGRSRLRLLHGKLQKIGRAYEKHQREWTILEAESAWRAAWHEPS